MNKVQFIESVISERNGAGQGVQRQLNENDVPPSILELLKKSKDK